MKQKVIAIVGPTASGKTGLAIEIAQAYDGEVISADSRQVYRGLDEGTAKVRPEETRGVPHHLIDVCDIDTVYTAADFTRDAEAAITAIASRGHLPIVAGGTFFYLDQLRSQSTTADVSPNPTLRAKLETKTTDELYQQLSQQDPRRAADIDPANKRRLIRALEIVAELGAVPSPAPTTSPYDFLTIGLQVDKEELRARFKARAEDWLSGPFAAEVERLLAAGVSRERLQEIGFEYMLMLEYLDGKLTNAEFVQKCIEKNWQYARRQMTWLKRDHMVQWIAPEEKSQAIHLVSEFLG